MKRPARHALLCLIALSAVGLIPTASNAQAKADKPAPPAALTGKPVLWREPGVVEKLDFTYGAGGRENAPKPPFTFVEESFSGTNPKVKVKDANGVQWTAKFGSEVNAETFATRLVWACGYFVEPAYFVPSGKIEGVNVELKRAKPNVNADGGFADARFERQRDKGVKKFEDEQSWGWPDNPFVGTKEFNGLRVLLMLASNWDNKDVRDFKRGSNTSIFQYPNEARYLVTDWGGSMGKWGGFLSREKWDCKGYASQSKDFVKGVKGGDVAFGYSGQHTSEFTKGITPADVKWLLQYLGRITDQQLHIGLMSSGATPDEVNCFVPAIRARIEQLKKVAQ